MCVKVNPLHVASSLTAENNEARKPPTISYMWALAAIAEPKPKNMNIYENN